MLSTILAVKKLSDIRTPEENNLAADMIVNFIRQQCADDKTELHVSIAGGRKIHGILYWLCTIFVWSSAG